MVGPELRADREPRVARARQDDPGGAERLAELDRDEPDRARALHEHRLAGDVAAHQVDRPERRGGRRDHAGLLEGKIRRQPVEGGDVVHRELGEPAVAGEALGAVALGDVAVVEAGRVPALDAVLAAVAALVHLDGNAVTDPELVDAGPEGGDRPGVLVAHHELAGRLTLERPVQHLHVRAADRGDLDLQEHFARAGLGAGPGLDAQVVGAVENRGFHRSISSHAILMMPGSTGLNRSAT